MADPKAPVKVTPIVIEGFEINAPNVTFQKLQEFSLTLYERLLMQRKERNFLMLERDKLLTILMNLRQEIRTSEVAAVNKEAELEQAQERHRQDIKEVEQEVKYLEYDHKLNLDQLQAWENSLATKINEENFEELIQLLQEKRRLKEEFAENEVKFEDQLNNLKKQHAQEIMDLKSLNEEKYIKKEIQFKKGLMDMKEEMTLLHEMELSEVEERKNSHLMELRSIHTARLEELKHFFNTVTAENLAVISIMKQSLDGIKKSKETMTEEMESLKRANAKLKIPLAKSKTEVNNLTRQLINYEKDLLSLKHNKRMLKETYGQLKKIKHETHNALKILKTGNESKPDGNLDPCCVQSLVQFRNYAATKRKQLEELTEKMLTELKKKQTILKELSSDPDVSEAIDELDFEYWCPINITVELEAAKKAYDEALTALEEKLEEFCVPESMLGYGLWRPQSTTGPAAFVSKQ